MLSIGLNKSIQDKVERGSFEMESITMLKSKGPRIEPCGTPEVTLISLEVVPSSTTLCFLPER